jgi:hypothetical protein
VTAAPSGPRDDRACGLYGKYRVERISDPAGKHDDCRFFVLDPQHDPHALVALRAYASSARAEFPALAADLEKLAADASPGDVPAEAIRDDRELLREVLVRYIGIGALRGAAVRDLLPIVDQIADARAVARTQEELRAAADAILAPASMGAELPEWGKYRVRKLYARADALGTDR